MHSKLLFPILVLACTAGCATVGTSISPSADLQPTPEMVLASYMPQQMPPSLADMGRSTPRLNARSRVDWAGALGLTRERVRRWPGVRSLRSLQPQVFDHLGVTLGRDQIGLTLSTRF